MKEVSELFLLISACKSQWHWETIKGNQCGILMTPVEMLMPTPNWIMCMWHRWHCNSWATRIVLTVGIQFIQGNCENDGDASVEFH